MTANSQLLTTEPKNKQTNKKKKKPRANNYIRNRNTEMEITWRFSGGVRGGEWGERYGE